MALRHHRSGELAKAEVRYREILAIDPNHSDSLHLLGVIAHQIGRNEQAIDLIGKAIALNDRVPAFHNNIGLALRAIGRLEDAVAHYTRGISLKPDFAEAYKNLGDVLKQQGKADAAMMQYQQVLLLKPDAVEIHNILGAALCERVLDLHAAPESDHVASGVAASHAFPARIGFPVLLDAHRFQFTSVH